MSDTMDEAMNTQNETVYEETVVVPTTESPDKDNKIKELNDKIAELENRLSTREICKRCGRELGTEPLTVSDEVMEEYFKNLLGQTPFEKTFKLFGGKLLLTFRELSGSAIIENNKRIEETKSPEEFADVVEMYLITGMLVRVETYDPKTMTTTSVYSMTDEQLLENTKNPKKAYDNLLQLMGQLQMAVIRRACTTFEYLLTALIEKGQDPNFYEDAGLL